ncbi:hypothetical protein [Brevundimonas sp.]|uniref:hypothetical protein n=1 Tax=Brevundimonas sp. TaxID=1871086 RepID=UPI0025C687E2|nr:hypothetical protein [Brevundimonas sp.]
MIVGDAALVQQKPEGEEPTASVQRHVAPLLLAARSCGEGLKLACGEQGFGQQGDVLIRRFAEAKVLGGDIDVP